MELNIDIRKCLRSLWFFQRSYPKLRCPNWARRDPLVQVFRDHSILLEEGRVVWAHIIQANSQLFGSGERGCPGEIVYDPAGAKGPRELAKVAGQMFSLKGTTPYDPALREVADYLSDELTRVFGRKVPRALSNEPLLYSTIYFTRRHLPHGRLCLPYFPILISDRCEGSTMVLPARWWPKELLELWDQAAASEEADPKT